MNLLRPDTGDILDRMTIVARKTVERPDDKHFGEELGMLVAALGERLFTGAWVAKLMRLAAINAANWQAEDEFRGYRKLLGDPEIVLPYEKLTAMAMKVQALNDSRADLVLELNRACGASAHQEKIR